MLLGGLAVVFVGGFVGGIVGGIFGGYLAGTSEVARPAITEASDQTHELEPTRAVGQSLDALEARLNAAETRLLARIQMLEAQVRQLGRIPPLRDQPPPVAVEELPETGPAPAGPPPPPPPPPSDPGPTPAQAFKNPQ